MFWNLGFGFLKNFGVFQNWWDICEIFGLGFAYMILYAHALHHICIFNIISCILMCVFLLEPCVLVGLDWAEPMMIFLLHVTWSCIIHAYIPFLFFLLVLFVIGTFLFVFLYLFPSLLNSLRMAPKCKSALLHSAPSRNPLHFGASSFDPTPLSIRFCDEKAR